MAEIIDILTLPFSTASRFTVNIAAAGGYVAVTPNAGPLGVWGSSGEMKVFQERDNLRVLSTGFYIPESFTTADWYTLSDGVVPTNTMRLTVKTAIRTFTPPANPPRQIKGIIYKALATAGAYTINHYYMWTIGNIPGVYEWVDFGNDVNFLPFVDYLPGYGSSNNGQFMIPFPNYEVALDLFCDIANLQSRADLGGPPGLNTRFATIVDNYYYIEAALYCNNISMIGVPAALDTKVISIIPFIKVLHTKPLIYAAP